MSVRMRVQVGSKLSISLKKTQQYVDTCIFMKTRDCRDVDFTSKTEKC